MKARNFDIATSVHPCCVQFLPSRFSTIISSGISHSDQSYFVCGEYELQEETSHRIGFLNVYNNRTGEQKLSAQCDSGILDFKIVDRYFASALSSGQLCFHSLNESGERIELATTFEDSDEGFFLSLSSSSLLQEAETDEIFSRPCSVAVSTERSSILVTEFNGAGIQEVCRFQNTHKLCGEAVPAWTVIFNPYDTNILLSGGDDSMGRLWDIRGNCCIGTLKTHEMGVTSACWNPSLSKSHSLLMGSYDGHMSFWDTRSLRGPVNKIIAGGGVWRSKWFTTRHTTGSSNDGSSFVMAACMHGGARLFRIDGAKDSGGEIAGATHCCSHFHNVEVDREHTNKSGEDSAVLMDELAAEKKSELCYGVDVVVPSSRDVGDSDDSSLLVVSSSFYENVISLWQVTL